MIEVMVTTAILMVVISGGWIALSMFNLNVDRVADHTAANFVIEGELERVRTIDYNPPVSPFTAGVVTWTSNVFLSLGGNGSNYQQRAIMRTSTRPAANGHLVTVSLTYSNAFSPDNIWMQTVVNQFSAGQP